MPRWHNPVCEPSYYRGFMIRKEAEKSASLKWMNVSIFLLLGHALLNCNCNGYRCTNHGVVAQAKLPFQGVSIWLKICPILRIFNTFFPYYGAFFVFLHVNTFQYVFAWNVDVMWTRSRFQPHGHHQDVQKCCGWLFVRLIVVMLIIIRYKSYVDKIVMIYHL